MALINKDDKLNNNHIIKLLVKTLFEFCFYIYEVVVCLSSGVIFLPMNTTTNVQTLIKIETLLNGSWLFDLEIIIKVERQEIGTLNFH